MPFEADVRCYKVTSLVIQGREVMRDVCKQGTIDCIM
jgi:hypothetical protein